MHYVKEFNINGVATKQVACIELQGAPNAATEGAVGVLAMDMSSLTHDVYRCVAVNGSVYTWELLSNGMSVMSSTITGEGGMTKSFPYDKITTPKNYLIKRGDLIIDSEGYIYHVVSIGASECETEYTGTHLGGASVTDRDYRLQNYGKILRLVTDSGSVMSEVRITLEDGNTIVYDNLGEDYRVVGAYDINGNFVQFFRGTQAQYDALTDAQKKNLCPTITDDPTKEDVATLEEKVETLEEDSATLKEDVSELETWKGEVEDGTARVARAKLVAPDYYALELKSGMVSVSWAVNGLYWVEIDSSSFIVATNASANGESSVNANNLRVHVKDGLLTYQKYINGAFSTNTYTGTGHYKRIM